MEGREDHSSARQPVARNLCEAINCTAALVSLSWRPQAVVRPRHLPPRQGAAVRPQPKLPERCGRELQSVGSMVSWLGEQAGVTPLQACPWQASPCTYPLTRAICTPHQPSTTTPLPLCAVCWRHLRRRLAGPAAGCGRRQGLGIRLWLRARRSQRYCSGKCLPEVPTSCGRRAGLCRSTDGGQGRGHGVRGGSGDCPGRWGRLCPGDCAGHGLCGRRAVRHPASRAYSLSA